MTYQKKNSYFKKKQPITNQTVIDEDKTNFIIAKRFNKFTSIVTPFFYNHDLEIYQSSLVVPHTRAQRINLLYNLMPKLAKYETYQDYIHYDCLYKLPPDVFDNYESGIIHLYMDNETTNVMSDDESEVNETVNIDIRLILNEIEDQDTVYQYKNNSKIMFTTKYLKVFPVVLSKGFILTIVNNEECIVYVSLLNPSKGYIGTCIRKEIANITQNIFPIWPIFNIAADESINKIFLKKEVINEIKPNNIHDKLLLKISYKFDDPSVFNIQKIASI
ncbi:MAG: hypothetical protein ACOC33_00700 [bacterium]